MRTYKSHGVKNFKYKTPNKKLNAIYNYLARPKISSLKSIEEADAFIVNFCKYELEIIGPKHRLALAIQENWELFKEAVKLNK